MWKKWMFANALLLAVIYVTADTLFGVSTARGERIVIPDLRGRTEESVAADGRFSVTAEYRYDDSPAGTVLSQTPSAGSVRKIGEDREKCDLRVVVSMGPELVTVPSLLGQNAKVAAAELRRLGLVAEQETTFDFAFSGRFAGEVVDVFPPAGSLLRTGESVHLTVWEGYFEE